MEPAKTVIRCESSEEFLGALSPISAYFQSTLGKPPAALFRGCADAAWKLIPSALRTAQGRTLQHQIRFEADLLYHFVSQCDEHGLPIPYDTAELRDQIISLRRGALPLWIEGSVSWPTDAWVTLMALAQHHGLPTRLLDWTASPFVAAYFAAQRYAAVGDDRDLAVWALTPFEAEIHDAPVHGAKKVVFMPAARTAFKTVWLQGWQGYAVIDTTRAGNANIVAQRGLLTAHVLGAVPTEAWGQPWGEPALEDMFTGWDSPSAPRLRKFVLSRQHASAVLEHLKRYGISTAAMFPGYTGAVRSALEVPPRGPHDL